MSETPKGSSSVIMFPPAFRHSKALANLAQSGGRGAPPWRAATSCNSVQRVSLESLKKAAAEDVPLPRHAEE